MFKLDSIRTYEVQLRDQPSITIANVSSLITTDSTIQLYDSTSTLLFTIEVANLVHFQKVSDSKVKKRDKRALKPEQVSLIHSLRAKGLTKDAIAKEAGVSFRSVKRYLSKSCEREIYLHYQI